MGRLTGNERRLVELCLERDTKAWKEFIQRYSRLVIWAIRERLRRWNYEFQDEDVEDICQDVFLNIWEKDKLKQLREVEKVCHWLVMVAGNTAVDYLRRKKQHEPPMVDSLFAEVGRDEEGTFTLSDLIKSADPTPSQDLAIKELGELLNETIEVLPPKGKMIIRLNLLYGKRYKQIARLMHIPINTVASTINKTKAKLREQLKARGAEDFLE